MAYMFNDDKSKNDVTEEPLIMTVKHQQTINKSWGDNDSHIYEFKAIYAIPTGYTPVGLLNVMIRDPDNGQFLSNVEIIQSGILDGGTVRINGASVTDVRISVRAVGQLDILLSFNILFVRSEFASIALPTTDDADAVNS